MRFKCDACDSVRDNNDISVLAKKGHINGVEVTQNIKYCNDNGKCMGEAHSINLLKGCGWVHKE